MDRTIWLYRVRFAQLYRGRHYSARRVPHAWKVRLKHLSAWCDALKTIVAPLGLCAQDNGNGFAAETEYGRQIRDTKAHHRRHSVLVSARIDWNRSAILSDSKRDSFWLCYNSVDFIGPICLPSISGFYWVTWIRCKTSSPTRNQSVDTPWSPLGVPKVKLTNAQTRVLSLHTCANN